MKFPKGVEAGDPGSSNLEEQYSVYFAAIADKENPWRHDPKKLAEVITDLYHERTGPLNQTDDLENVNSNSNKFHAHGKIQKNYLEVSNGS